MSSCFMLGFFQQWYDHYLQWNQSEYPGVKNLRFSSDQVWTPDILLYNRYVWYFKMYTQTVPLLSSELSHPCAPILQCS